MKFRAKKCLIEGCANRFITLHEYRKGKRGHNIGVRGLCYTHWTNLKRRVKRGEVTWEQLEEWGMALIPLRGVGSLPNRQIEKMLESHR